MILTTTNSVEDYKILAYRGIVSGTSIDMQKMTLTFNMTKYYEGLTQSVNEVKAKAFEELKADAEKLNANAVIGISIDIELTTSNCIMVSVSGTAVSIVKR
ncbi:heavy metal-binding domain-containing protein [Flavobacterium antarcticum]|uniref:heavy metal-binding domain-containing protein n=1 Tax=Flavobacterium antarcticum TaxID=271155 RepID=UPI0003B61E8F|nr:heavy metal-binding domain-containing protein [Flavobacterium antarcticum]